MKRPNEETVGLYGPSAKVVDGKLILSLFDAINPIVWTFDLAQTKASALEVRNGPDSTFTLVSKTAKGEMNEIAVYDSRQRATQALMTVGQAMESGEGRLARPVMTTTANDSQPYSFAASNREISRTVGRRRGWLAPVIAVLVVLLALYGIFHIGPRQGALPADGASLSAASGAAGSDTSTTGTPVNADAFLQQQPH